MVRTIRVRDATILANIHGREIDFEVRNNKACRGFTLLVDGKKWLDCDVFPYTLGGGGIKDGEHYDSKKPLFRIRDIKSNGVL